MENMFAYCYNFNGNMFKNVQNVTNMRYMFHNCYNFNQDLDNFIISDYKCINMFRGCQKFNKYLNVVDDIYNGTFHNCYSVTQLIFLYNNFFKCQPDLDNVFPYNPLLKNFIKKFDLNNLINVPKNHRIRKYIRRKNYVMFYSGLIKCSLKHSTVKSSVIKTIEDLNLWRLIVSYL